MNSGKFQHWCNSAKHVWNKSRFSEGRERAPCTTVPTMWCITMVCYVFYIVKLHPPTIHHNWFPLFLCRRPGLSKLVFAQWKQKSSSRRLLLSVMMCVVVHEEHHMDTKENENLWSKSWKTLPLLSKCMQVDLIESKLIHTFPASSNFQLHKFSV